MPSSATRLAPISWPATSLAWVPWLLCQTGVMLPRCDAPHAVRSHTCCPMLTHSCVLVQKLPPRQPSNTATSLAVPHNPCQMLTAAMLGRAKAQAHHPTIPQAADCAPHRASSTRTPPTADAGLSWLATMCRPGSDISAWLRTDLHSWGGLSGAEPASTPSLHLWDQTLRSVVQGAQACLRGLGSVSREFGQINIYDIYVDFCLRGQQQSAQRLAQASGHDPRLLGPWAAAMGACVPSASWTKGLAAGLNPEP